VKTWIKRVEKVALIHGASDSVTLLAASSKLVKSAKQWYDMHEGPSNESWINLKHKLLKMFHRKVPFFKAMQKIETRKWQSNRETFDQYVLAKLVLIHGLDLPPRDVIHLLIGGILPVSIRAAALSLTTESMEDFIDRKRNIAKGCAETGRRSEIERRSGSTNKTKVKQCRNCGESSHMHQECKKDIKCFFCKKPGHRQYDCPAAKEKSRIQLTPSCISSTPAVVAEDVSIPEPIAYVAEPVRSCVELQESSVLVDSIGGRRCSLTALLDTGSAVLFVKYTIYLKYCKYFSREIRSTVRKFVNLKDSPLEIIGSIEAQLTLSLLGDRPFNVTLFVLKDQAFAHDLILGRDFLSAHNLTIIFKFSRESW